MKRRNLSGISNYADLLRFVRSSAALNVTDEEAIRFYTDAPEQWKQTFLNACLPSPEVEKAIIRYADADTIHLLATVHGFYSETIAWAMRQEFPDIAEMVVKNLKDKPSSDIEELMVRRCDADLLRLWIKKFRTLDDGAEKILNEDPSLNSLLHLYIELQS